MAQEQEDELIMQTVRWMLSFNEAMVGASGSPRHVIDMFSTSQLINLIRNNLHIKHLPLKQKRD